MWSSQYLLWVFGFLCQFHYEGIWGKMRGPQKMKMGKQDLLKQKWEGCNLLKRKIGVNRPGKNYWPIPNVSECCAMAASSQMVSGFQCLSQTCWGTIYRTPHWWQESWFPVQSPLCRIHWHRIGWCYIHTYIPMFVPLWLISVFYIPTFSERWKVNPAQLRTRSQRCQDRRVLGEGRLVPEAQSFHGVRWLLPSGSTLGN